LARGDSGHPEKETTNIVERQVEPNQKKEAGERTANEKPMNPTGKRVGRKGRGKRGHVPGQEKRLKNRLIAELAGKQGPRYVEKEEVGGGQRPGSISEEGL